MSRHTGAAGSVTLAAAVVRGMRARSTLTVGCLLLAGVAIASAVLGPAYERSSSQSFLVARLRETTPVESGVSFKWTPPAGVDVGVDEALDRAPGFGAQHLEGLFGDASLSLESGSVPVTDVLPEPYPGSAHLLAKNDVCSHLDVKGRCPTAVGETMLLKADAVFSRVSVGDHIPFPGLKSGLDIVGTYTVPDDAVDFIFDDSRYRTTPPAETVSGPSPYLPAPLIVDRQTFDAFSRGWLVDVDRQLNTPPDISPDQVRAARKAVVTLPEALPGAADGTFTVSKDNTLQYVITEIDANRDTAGNTVLPAVVSLVLVALALLVRLLSAAADQRRSEVALASIRGLSGRQMWAFGLAEPLTVMALATPLGIALGYGAAVGLGRLWLIDGVPVSLATGSIVAAAVVFACAVAATVFSVGRALSEPLSSQLAGVRRPTKSSRWAFVAKAALLVTAGVVVAGSITTKARSDPQSSDVALPLLLAAAVGLITSAAAVVIARQWARRTSSRRGITGFVATRAVSRRREASLVILPLTAALAIAVFAAGVYAAASAWRTSVAATAVGADNSYVSPRTLSETVALTHQIDPDGKYLMAAGVVINGEEGEKLVLDTPRLGRVGVWPETWTPGHDGSDVAGMLGPAGEPLAFEGSSLGLTIDNQIDSGGTSLGVSVQLLSEGPGVARRVFLGPFPEGVATRTTKAKFCRDGCEILSIFIGGGAATQLTMKGSLDVTALTVDGTPMPSFTEGSAWRSDVSYTGATPNDTKVSSAPGGQLRVTIDTAGQATLQGVTPSDVPAARPVLTGRTADETLLGVAGDVEVLDNGGVDGLPVQSVGITDSMPFLGPHGIVIDYTMMIRDQIIPDTSTQAYVLARGDTPAEMLSALHDAGVTSRTQLSSVKGVLDQDAYALSLNLYLVAALAAIVLAGAGLAVTLAVQMPERRRDAASMRVVGVRRRQILRAVFVEILAVLGAAGVAGVVAGAASQYLVVRTLTLGFADELRTPRVVPTLDAGGLSLLVAVVVGALAGVATFVAAMAVRRARASTLRESVR
ncbi:MAG TPA: FtsX-like permease family protein [Nocardioidaceae bacterium]|nr:FtsX-like permease family protein [Nocardioidaceae bacterium]